MVLCVVGGAVVLWFVVCLGGWHVVVCVALSLFREPEFVVRRVMCVRGLWCGLVCGRMWVCHEVWCGR